MEGLKTEFPEAFRHTERVERKEWEGLRVSVEHAVVGAKGAVQMAVSFGKDLHAFTLLERCKMCTARRAFLGFRAGCGTLGRRKIRERGGSDGSDGADG